MRILLSVSGLVLAFLLNTASAQPAWTEASDSNLVPGKPIKASQIKEIRDAIGWNVSGGNAYRASGNVGIGTASPDHKFHVRTSGGAVARFDSAAGSSYLRLTVLNDMNKRIELANRNGRTALWNPNTYDAFNVVHSSGNVGIGTTSPGRRLHVAGDGIRISNSSWNWLEMYGGHKTLRMHYGDSTNDLRFGRYGSNFGSWEANPVRFDLDAPDSSLVLRDTGNVGIGTTSPTQKLSVAGNIDLNDGELYLRDAAGGTFGMGYATEGGSQMTLFGDHLIQFTESDADVVRVHMDMNNGNVGIGTTSPTSGLHIARGTDISSVNDTSAGLLIGTGGARLAIDGNEMQAHNGTSAIGYALQPFGGSIGIGRFPNSAYKLDVAGNIRATGQNIINNTAPTVYLQDTDHRSGMIHMNSSRMYFLRGSGNNSLSWAHTGGHWPLYLNMENNDAHFGGDVYIKGQKVGGGGGGGGLGVGQTWVDVRFSRTAGTIYQNTTGKPISVFILAGDSSAGLSVRPTSSSAWVGVCYGRYWEGCSGIVPNGHYYKASGGVRGWAELR